MAIPDPQTTFHIHQAFADLRPYTVGPPAAPPPLTREAIARDVQAAFAGLDRQQLAITRRLSPAQRFRQVCELNRFLRHAIIAAIRQQQPGIGEAELRQHLLHRMGVRRETLWCSVSPLRAL
jgi:hypothetical protein